VKRKAGPVSILAGLLILSACRGGGYKPVTTGSLFEEMTDLTALARFPNPGFRLVQFSSYDRRSHLPGGPDWFANDDGFGGETIPNFEKVLKAPDGSGLGEYLIADVPGPGAIVRLWTASIAGKIRLYIDDMERPLYEGEADTFFRRPYDAFPGMTAVNGERFRKTVYQRDASYAPFPFAKRFRLIWIGNIQEIHFYHLMARLYDRGTAVISFRPEDIGEYRDAIDRVTQVLSDPDTLLTSLPKSQAKIFDVSLRPGEKQEVVAGTGPGAVYKLILRLRADDLDRALRQTILFITCDGHAVAQVQSPAGDFFGAAPGINPFQSLPFSVGEDSRMICRFVMPFRSSLRIGLENRGGQPVRAEGEVRLADSAWVENSLHFYARWRVDHNLIASDVDVQDLAFLLARGKGRYVGTTSILLNPATVPTSWGNWWGEGDEKVFVDDDNFPAIFGTGSEDYYNYSWSSPDIFSFPYCGQPRNDGPGNRGFVSNFRWHILDSIPFAKSLDFYMELNSHERTPGMSYARIGYYYARPGTIDDHRAIEPEDLRELHLPASWQPAARFGARDSVFYQVEEVLADRRATHLEEGSLWAGGKELIWTPEKAGDRIKLRIPVDSPGKTQIHITATLTPRSGKIAAWLDGQPLDRGTEPETIDLFTSFRTLLRDFSLRPSDLPRGIQTLILEYRGAGPDIAKPEIGLDFIWVQKLESGRNGT
jgi:hypothetical protein